eukprot:snap_masked-scaffold_4-processed-gene-8.33-mRNA-1 protein AED:1.00 eAED:1.00 QI:0/-1/0/0/-1/1/1/0/463
MERRERGTKLEKRLGFDVSKISLKEKKRQTSTRLSFTKSEPEEASQYEDKSISFSRGETKETEFVDFFMKQRKKTDTKFRKQAPRRNPFAEDPEPLFDSPEHLKFSKERKSFNISRENDVNFDSLRFPARNLFDKKPPGIWYQPGELPLEPVAPSLNEEESELDAYEREVLGLTSTDDSFMEKFKTDFTSLDLNDKVVSSNILMTKSGTYYDYGHKETVRTPRPLSELASVDISPSTGILEAYAAAMSPEQNIKKVFEAAEEEITQKQREERTNEATTFLQLKESNFILSKGSLLPSHPSNIESDGKTKQNDEDINEISMKVIQDAQDTGDPVLGRILQQTKPGFIVAVGTNICFLPKGKFYTHKFSKEHDPEIIFGKTDASWKFGQQFVGLRLWLQVENIKTFVNRDGEEIIDVIVSHRNLPKALFLKQFRELEYIPPFLGKRDNTLEQADLSDILKQLNLN